jgi:uncharacterized protein YdaU (DUF1376 family)
MNNFEFGAYVRILLQLWLAGGMIPESKLYRSSGCSPKMWALAHDTICAPLTVAGGMVSQKRLIDTRLKVKDKRKKLVEASALGVAARRAKIVNQMVQPNGYQMVQPNGQPLKLEEEDRLLLLTSQSEPVAETPHPALLPESKQAAAEDPSSGKSPDKMTLAEITAKMEAGRALREQRAAEKRERLTQNVATDGLAGKIRREARRGY